MIDPSTMTAMPPGTESWGERYGVIGVVAMLALAALALGLRQFLVERKADRDRVTGLHDQLVETVREGHRETLKLLADQQQAHEARYQALLDRHMGETRQHAEALRAQSTATVEALNGVVKKLSRNE